MSIWTTGMCPPFAYQAAAELAFNSTSAWMDPALVPADAKVQQACLVAASANQNRMDAG